MSQETLVSFLICNKVLSTPRIIEAFLDIDRADFVSENAKNQAYEDHPITLALNSTISQPTTVAFMLELLQPTNKDHVLDLGSGSGWTTALIASCLGEQGEVLGVEINPELVSISRDNLRKYDFSNAEIYQAQPKKLGLPRQAPFDKILVSAAANDLPTELIKQLRIGGTMVIPIQNSIYKITRLKNSELEIKEYPGFSFVPLIEI